MTGGQRANQIYVDMVKVFLWPWKQLQWGFSVAVDLGPLAFQTVSHQVLLFGQVLLVLGELQNVGQVTMLAGGSWISHLGHGKSQRLVVHKSGEVATFLQGAKVSDGKV